MVGVILARGAVRRGERPIPAIARLACVDRPSPGSGGRVSGPPSDAGQPDRIEQSGTRAAYRIMRTAAECERQAELLDRLAEAEEEAFRRSAYRQMAEFWRASARLRRPSRPQ